LNKQGKIIENLINPNAPMSPGKTISKNKEVTISLLHYQTYLVLNLKKSIKEQLNLINEKEMEIGKLKRHIKLT
jgi:hypothetical protein